MNKITKYSIVGIIVAGCAALAYNAFMPKENDELNQAPKSASGRQGKTLNVRAVVVEQQLLTDGLSMSGSLVPDEEVSLSFETSGKITDIFFKEGSMVEKGQLLAKINDAPLQAELRRKEAQLRLMQDRVYRAFNYNSIIAIRGKLFMIKETFTFWKRLKKLQITHLINLVTHIE